MRPGGALTEATRNLTTSSKCEAEAGGLRSLKSPVPYFFGGLAIIITLISITLLILACSHCKLLSSSSSSSSSQDQQQESKATVDVGGEVDSEPKIVVVMAGDTKPTFLAKPLPLANNTHAQQSL